MRRLKMGIGIGWLLLAIGVLPVFAQNTAPEAVPVSFDAAPGTGPAPIVREIIIHIEDLAPKEDPKRVYNIARDLIFLEEGEPFSPEKLQETIDALKLCQQFKDIHIDSKDTPAGIKLIFNMSRFHRISNITVDGAFPILDQEVTNVMTIYTGDAFDEEKLDEQKERIIDLFKGEGFISPEVTIETERDEKSGNYAVHVEIEKGEYYSVEDLTIKGNDAFSDIRLKLRMDTWPPSFLPWSAGRFVEKDLDSDVKNLKEFYRGKKYPEVEIDAKAEKNEEKRTADITVTIEEGPKYDVEITGNDEFWGFTLNNDLVLFEEGNLHGRGLRKSVTNIRERYKEAGFLDAEVTVAENEIDAQGEARVREIRIDIDEGTRSVVKSLDIAGNTVFDDEKIKKQMVTEPPSLFNPGAFVPEEFEKDKQAIQTLYYQDGYRNAEVKSDLTWNEAHTEVVIDLRIEEGIQTTVSDLTITGNTVISDADAREMIELKPGEPFREYMMESDKNTLATAISPHGYPHVTVTRDYTITDDGKNVSVSYDIDEGNFVEMGDFYVVGNFRTKRKIILRDLLVVPGEPFSVQELLKAQQKIRNLDIFDQVRFKSMGLQEKEDTVNLFVEVEEKKPYVIQFGLGYDTGRNLYASTRAKNRNLLGLDLRTWLEAEVSQISTRAKNRNLLGLDLRTWLEAEVSQIGYRADYGLQEPRLMGSEIGATFGLFAERRDEFNQEFEVESFGSSLLFDRPITEKLHANLGFRYEHREQFRDDRPDIIEEGDILYTVDEFEPRQIFVTSPSLTYDTRDSFVDPTKGTFTSVYADISMGMENSLDNFVKYGFDARWYYSPAQWLTFALRGQAGHIEPYGSIDKVADDQLFFLGGISDIRGFDENLLRRDGEGDPAGGMDAVMGTVEARIDIGGNFELTTFYDIGTVSDTFSDTASEEYRHTAGAGLRYMTPIGPIGFLYGVKLDRQEEEDFGRFHFSVGYTF